MMKKKTLIAVMAGMVACLMLGVTVGAAFSTHAVAEEGDVPETRVVVTSPFTEPVKQVRGSVVGVNNYQYVRYGYGFGRGNSSEEVRAASGSGVVIAEDYVLTNYHVVEGASSLKIAVMQENGSSLTEYDATLAAYDSNLDLAVLRCPGLGLTPVTLGDSDTLQVGDWAICIGNPIGDQFFGTVTVDIVSALDRSISSRSFDRYGRRSTVTNTMIQVDADINSGNSGGGMFSVTGELMGIPTLKYTGSVYIGAQVDGINMCIPINAAKPLIEDALSGEPARQSADPQDASEDNGSGPSLIGKPRLGVTIASLNTSSYAIMSGQIPNGVYVRSVDDNSPAAAAGIVAGDIIVEVDGTVITSVTQLQEIIGRHAAGDTIQVKVFHADGMADAVEKGGEIPADGQYKTWDVVLAVVDDIRQ